MVASTKPPILELERTRDALEREIAELMRRKLALEASISAPLDVDVRARVADHGDAAHRQNRRFLAAVIDQEILRAAREDDHRFSVVRLVLRDPAPSFFEDFVLHTVRLADLAVRVGPRVFLVMLHRAGGLGRRLFMQRFVRTLRTATRHHDTTVSVAAGAATFPIDGTSADRLLARSLERLKPIFPATGASLFAAEASPDAESAPTALLPPTGTDATALRASGVSDALERAALDGRSGEIVVKQDELVGRVYLHEGRVAWAHASTRQMSLTEHLIRTRGADAEEVRFAFEHCRQTGRNFAETLIELGTFDRDEMRGILRDHLASHIEAILAFPSPEVLFLPQSRHYGSDLTFSLAELQSLVARRQRIVDGLAAHQQRQRTLVVPARS